MDQVTTTISGQEFVISPADVNSVAKKELPEPLKDHYVVIDGHRYPPKQVIEAITGLDRADFTTHQARNILRRLGFTVARRSRTGSSPGGEQGREHWPHGGRLAQALKPYTGQWVAVMGAEVLVASPDPAKVISWLNRHNVTTEGIFRVSTRDPTEVIIVD